MDKPVTTSQGYTTGDPIEFDSIEDLISFTNTSLQKTPYEELAMTKTTQDKLAELLSRCKCGVFLTVNEHRDYYDSSEKALEEKSHYECPPEIEEDVRKIMIETDTIVALQFYPDTPIGSYSIYHYDLDAALTKALECFI